MVWGPSQAGSAVLKSFVYQTSRGECGSWAAGSSLPKLQMVGGGQTKHGVNLWFPIYRGRTHAFLCTEGHAHMHTWLVYTEGRAHMVPHVGNKLVQLHVDINNGINKWRDGLFLRTKLQTK